MSVLADQIDALLLERVECRPGIPRWLVGGEARQLLYEASSAIAHLEAQLQEARKEAGLWEKACHQQMDTVECLSADASELAKRQDALLAALVRAEGNGS